MCNTYFIRGTISVQVDREKLTPTIWITPCTGFLAPDKQKAIVYPVLLPEDKAGDAKLIKMSEDKQFEFEAKAIKDYIPSLLNFAAQQKSVELHLDLDLKIVGFIFPAPLGHA